MAVCDILWETVICHKVTINSPPPPQNLLALIVAQEKIFSPKFGHFGHFPKSFTTLNFKIFTFSPEVNTGTKNQAST